MDAREIEHNLYFLASGVGEEHAMYRTKPAPKRNKQRRAVEQPHLFDEDPSLRIFHNSAQTIYPDGVDPEIPRLFYRHPNGEVWLGDAIVWLQSLPTSSVDLVFADPPYNVKKAEWDTFESQHAYVAWSQVWIREVARVLKPTGAFYICGYSEILADLKLPASRFFAGCRWLVWHYKNKANLGNDWGRSHESILHFRKSNSFTLNMDAVRIPYSEHTLKYPEHPQALSSQYGQGKTADRLWQPHPQGAKPKDVIEIPTTCNGMHEKTPHPTQKPEELLRTLVLAATNIGDLVIDPFLGSGTTAVVAEQLQRKWKGCDNSAAYCQWAAQRIELVEDWSIEQWIAYDRRNAERRKSLR
jgi:site-specific DNA-methyltransferase (adenine-specific)